MKVEIKILNKGFYTEKNLPDYATAGSAALDLIVTEDVVIRPQERVKIHTGLAIWAGSELPQLPLSDLSVAALIIPRSGLGSKGLVLANTIGLIDSDYQGELIVNVWNNNIEDKDPQKYFDVVKKTIILEEGERFAQLLFIPVIKAQWDVVEEFTQNTDRGDGGFGHSGR